MPDAAASNTSSSSHAATESESSAVVATGTLLRGPMSLRARLAALLGPDDADRYLGAMETAARGRLVFDSRSRRHAFSVDDLK